MLFNLPGRNGSFEVASYTPPRSLHVGEKLRFTLLHQREGVGAFWGPPSEITEAARLDHLSQEQTADYLAKFIHLDGRINCRIIITKDDGQEVARDVSMLAVHRDKLLLNIIDDAKIEAYDPRRLIPYQGSFLS